MGQNNGQKEKACVFYKLLEMHGSGQVQLKQKKPIEFSEISIKPLVEDL